VARRAQHSVKLRGDEVAVQPVRGWQIGQRGVPQVLRHQAPDSHARKHVSQEVRSLCTAGANPGKEGSSWPEGTAWPRLICLIMLQGSSGIRNRARSGCIASATCSGTRRMAGEPSAVLGAWPGMLRSPIPHRSKRRLPPWPLLAATGLHFRPALVAALGILGRAP